MKKQIKTENCLNCHYIFKENESYCPQCGQENDLKVKSLRLFFKDFFEDLTSIDTRFYQTIPAFLFHPGRLTNAFLEGKRRKYVSPIRLYLTFSFIYFLIFSLQMNQESNWEEKLKQKPDKMQVNLHIENKRSKKKSNKNEDDSFVLLGIDFVKVASLSKIENIQENQIFDTLKIEKTFTRQLMVRQLIRFSNAKEAEINKAFLGNIPLMMFFLLPVFALFLKLIYIRRKKYYIEHLIFTLHFHAFYFFMFSVLIILTYLLPEGTGIIILLSLILMFLYTYKSFRNVYKQNRLKTLLKLFTFGMIYPIILSIGLIFVLIWSFLFF